MEAQSEQEWAESIIKALREGRITAETIDNLPPYWRKVFEKYAVLAVALPEIKG